MSNEKLSHNYNISKNYTYLYKLIQTQRVVCFVSQSNKSEDGHQIQNICQSQVLFKDKMTNIGVKGEAYICAFNEKDFIIQCKVFELEFIDPNRNK